MMENNQFLPVEETGEIVLYQPDDNVRLEVRLQDDTVWLTQQQMTELFKTTKQNVSLHINNIFREGELMSDSVVKESLTTAGDGKNYRTKYYNLDQQQQQLDFVVRANEKPEELLIPTGCIKVGFTPETVMTMIK